MPPAAARDVWAALGGARARHPAARWVPVENLHVTLVFLGGTPPERVPEIARLVTDAASGADVLAVSTAEPGGRVDERRGGVAWLRLEGPGARGLARLARELDARIDARRKGRVHAAHVTVARRATDELIADLAVPPIRFTIETVALFRSHTGPAGAHYEPLLAVPLGGA